MQMRYEVRSPSGELLGIFPAPLDDHVRQIRDIIAQKPDAEVRPVAMLDNPCKAHPAYEADNCPACGTSPTID